MYECVGSLENYRTKMMYKMDIEVITTEEEYQAVLQRIDELMGASKGSPEYEEL